MCSGLEGSVVEVCCCIVIVVLFGRFVVEYVVVGCVVLVYVKVVVVWFVVVGKGEWVWLFGELGGEVLLFLFVYLG